MWKVRWRTKLFAGAITTLIILVCLLGIVNNIPVNASEIDIGYSGVPRSPLDLKLNTNADLRLNHSSNITCEITCVENNTVPITVEISIPLGIVVVDGKPYWKGNISNDHPVKIELIIKPIKTGVWVIDAKTKSVLSETEWFGAHDILYMEISEGNSSVSHSQISSNTGSSVQLMITDDAESEESGVLISPTPSTPRNQTSEASRQSEASTTGMLTVVGRFLYQNANNNWMGTRWTTVYIYDVEPLGNWDYLGSVLTDSTGGFTFGPINNDDGLGQNGLDIIVVFSTTSSAAEVIDADDDIYQCQTQEYTNCPDGTLDIGSQGCPSSQYGAWRIFTYITDGWNYLSNGPANYEMTKSTAKWPYEDWPHYHTGGEIHIPGDGDSDRSPDVIQHEYAHNVMYVIYGGWWPPNAGGEHTIRRISNVNMAWTEGWAEFFPMASQNDPWFTWVNHYTINLETPTWGTPNWDNGDAVEGRVAGALYDIFDSQNDGYDRFSDGFTRIWNTISSQADGRYSEFFQAWISKGYSQSTFVATAYQNTIDYDNVYPSASITKPKSGYLYVNDIEVGSTGTTNTIIIGDIIIKASASDAGGIYKVEFYIDGQLKYTDWDSSYEWKWTPSVGQHTIKVTAYDNAGQSTSRTINVIAAGTGDLGISFDNNYNTSFLLRGDLVSIQMEDVLLINRDEIADN